MNTVQKTVNLVFNADTNRAKQSIQELYNTLDKLSSLNAANASGQVLATDLKEASMAAASLKANLESAMNVNTGKLDLNKFNSNLNKSKMSLQDYQRILTQCGPAGKQAFSQLAQSIVTADASVIKLSAKVRALGTTLANTAKWQISSSIVHGITGALSSAYNYAKDLNESLNSIRIVTGKSTVQMKAFAAEANRAAKELSASTTAYTDASLIFYQQGLDDEDVKKRTDAVIKMAAVTGESSKQVSDYMTAIWNNFDNGTKSLEYYADVLTKLGAATASSTDEIAGGLEKFSAIADTIGLSYEYAASALATITAKTRQSEDVVGTALKTIFARIQGLNLGETLEDGVSLNKYSEALSKVGISIFDTSGEMKNMNTILDEMGEKWSSLSAAEQTALAQTVAGVRQYNQLISLMDNYSDFKINVDLAMDAEGTLESQFTIYEQSWKGASQRLKASFEDMYDSLINDEAFIKLTDFFANLIDSISGTIDSIGGLKGILLVVSSVLMKVYQSQLGAALDSIELKMQRIFTGTNAGLMQVKQQAAQMLVGQYQDNTLSGGVQSEAALNMQKANEAYLLQVEKLGPLQKSIAENLLKQNNTLNESVIKQGEEVKLLERKYEILKRNTNITTNSKQTTFNNSDTWTQQDKSGKVVGTEVGYRQKAALKHFAESQDISVSEPTSKTRKQMHFEQGAVQFKNNADAIKIQTAAMEQYKQATEQASMIQEGFINTMSGMMTDSPALEALSQDLENFSQKTNKSDADYKDFQNTINGATFANLTNEVDRSAAVFDSLESSLKQQGKTLEQAFGGKGAKAIVEYGTRLKQAKTAQDQIKKSSQTLTTLQAKLNKTVEGSKNHAKIKKAIAAEEKTLATATEQYTTAINGNKAAMAQEGQAGQTLRQVFEQVNTSMVGLQTQAQTAKDALLALGYSDDQLLALEQACTDLNVDFGELIVKLAQAKLNADNFGQNMDKLAVKSNTVGQTISRIGSFASQAAMGLNALSGLSDIWSNEDLTTGEKITSSLMNMAMILPLVGTAIDGVTKMKLLTRAASEAAAGGIRLETQEQMKQIGVTSLETAGLWGKAAAWIAAHPLLAGIGIAAAAAGIAIMAIMTANEKANTKAVEEAAEAAKKKAEASKELSEASQEELDTAQDLYDTYDDLYDEYTKTKVIKSDLITATTNLVNELGIENGHLLIAQGRYEELNAKIKEYLALKAQENAGNTQTTFEDTLASGGASLTESKSEKFFMHDEASEAGHEKQHVMGFWDVGDNDKWFTEYLTSNYKDGPWEIVGDKVVAYYSDASQVPLLQSQFDTIFKAALENAGGVDKLSDDEKSGSIFSQYQVGILNGGNEVASKAWKDTQSSGETATQASFESALYAGDVTDAESYNRVKDAWIEEQVAKGVAAGMIEDYARTYYTTQANNYVTGSQFATYANTGSAIESQKKILQSGSHGVTYDQLIEEGYSQEIILSAVIDPGMTKEQIYTALELAQMTADNNEITMTVTAATEGLAEIENIKTAKDYDNWWLTYGEQALKNSGYDKNTFADLSLSQQKEILNKQTKLKTASTTELSLSQANTRAGLLEQERTDFIAQNPEFFDEQGNLLGKDKFINDFDTWTTGIDNSGTISGGQLEWIEGILQNATDENGQPLAMTSDNIQQFLEDYYNVSTSMGRAKDAFKQQFNQKYNISYDQNTANLSRFAQGMLGEEYDSYMSSEGADARAQIIGEALKVANDNNIFTNYNDRVRTDKDYNKIKSQYTDITSRQANNAATITKLEEEQAAALVENPMAYKETLTELELDIDTIYELADSLEDLAGETEDFSQDLKNNDIALKEAAKQLGRYNKAVEAASGKIEEWKEALNGKDLVKQTQATKELAAIYADMFDLDANDFSDGFLRNTEYLDLMEQAMSGNVDAYNKLQAIAAKDIISQKFGELPGITQEFLETISSTKIAAGELIDLGEHPIGEKLQTLYQTAVTAAMQGGKSVAEAMAEANALMQAEGFEPPEVEMEVKTVYIKGQLPNSIVPVQGQSYSNDDLMKAGVEWKSEPGGDYTEAVQMLVPKATKIRKSTENVGGATTKPSGGGGGGDKKKTKKSDVVERYKEINDELNETSRKMNKASKLADTLWGDSRFDKIQEGIDLLKEENAELERKAQLQQQYLAEDRTALDAAAAAAGVSFTYGADGNITNYTSEMERLYAQLKTAEDSNNASEVERLTKLIEELEDARKQYEETLQEGFDLDEQHLENQIKIWAENFKKITEKLELEIKINDQDLAILEYYLKKVEGNAFQAAESFALLVDQQKEHTENLTAYRKAYEDAKKAYEAGEISETEYKEAIEQAQQGILDELSALQDLQEQMEDYYGNTIAMAQEEMAAFIEQMEHSTSVLDHYSSILDIIGKQQDYATKGTVLKGRADSLRNELETQRKLYEDYSKDADEYYTKMMAAEVGSDEYLYYKKQWEAAQQAANEAQENMLAKTEEWAEAMKAVVENELEGLATTLEEAMTGGTNFDTMLTSMERASSLQEEYLTTTNKIYETNKLMRTAQQEIDKTTNSIAKRRLSQFIKETEQLQSQNKLSNYELEIQQAKYDLLLAEIALEEAQNAKSTVRLQRDSEGNFGYVYTADSSAIAEAESQLADAQNSLYNIGLEGANDYGQKYAETMSEMYDTLKELQIQYLEGAFDNEEEYNNAVAEAKKYYYEKLEQYSSLYSVALTTDSRVVADAWSTDFNEMIYKTDEWKARVDEYTAEAAQTLGEWQQTVADILAKTGLDDTAAAVKDITDKSKELATFLNGEGGLIDVLSKERDEIKLVIDQNKDWATSVAAITKEYEDLLKQLQLDYKAPSQGNNNDKDNNNNNNNSNGNNNNNSNGNNNSNDGNRGNDDSQTPTYTYKFGWAKGQNAKWYNSLEDLIDNIPLDEDRRADTSDAVTFHAQRNDGKIGNYIIGDYYEKINGNWHSKGKPFVGFDTGGYTGSWGSYGKMAMLHEKELVLNAHDTENFLASMELLNRIIEVINLHSASAQLYGLSMTPGRMTGFDNGALEQHVTIEANFPSVQDRNEIEEAFTNLINQASQYANRTQY